MLAFARSVDDATHDGDLELLDTRVLRAPHGHLGSEEVVNFLGQFLKCRAGGAAASRAGRDTGYETAQTQRLQNF